MLFRSEAIPAGIPFPMPKSGAEAVWNHKLRWSGGGRTETYSTIFSEPSGRGFVPLVQNQWTLTPFGIGNGIPAGIASLIEKPSSAICAWVAFCLVRS